MVKSSHPNLTFTTSPCVFFQEKLTEHLGNFVVELCPLFFVLYFFIPKNRTPAGGVVSTCLSTAAWQVGLRTVGHHLRLPADACGFGGPGVCQGAIFSTIFVSDVFFGMEK